MIDDYVFEHTYVSYKLNAIVIIPVNMFRSAYTLTHLRKLSRQTSKLNQLATVQHVMINNHSTLSESTPLWRQSA
jgi:hypothetical protein